MEKNTAGKWVVFAYGLPDHANAGQAITGDAANIIANIRIDGGAANAVGDTNPTELEDGYYIFDITAAEANGDLLSLHPTSSTANVQVIGVPGAVWTRPANFNTLGIASDGDISGNIDGNVVGSVASVTAAITLPTIPTNWITAAGINASAITAGSIAASALDGKGDWNIGKTGYSLTQAFPTNFADLAITATTGKTTVGTNDDKTGYSISGTKTTLDALNDVSTAQVNTEADTALSDMFTSSAQLVDDIWDEVLSGGAHNVVNSAGRRLRQLETGLVLDSGTLDAATAGTADLETGVASTQNDYYNHNLLVITGGTGAGQVRLIADYAGTGEQATIVPNWTVTPDATSTYDIIPGITHTETSKGGYDGGRIYIAPSGSTTAILEVDGTITNPIDDGQLTNAKTVADAENIEEYFIEPGSSVTLNATYSNWLFTGDNWTLALGSQSVSGCKFSGASGGVSGTATGTDPFFYECSLGNVTLPPCAIQTSGLSGTLTVGSAGNFFLIDCFSQIAGASSPTIDMGAAVGASNVSLRRFAGGITINNIAAGDVVSLDGTFGTVTLNGSDGTVEIRGIAKIVTDNRTGSPTLNDDTVKETDIASILTDTGTTLDTHLTDIKGATFNSSTDSLEAIRNKQTDIETDTQDLQNRVPSGLVNGRMDSNMSAIDDSNTAAVNLKDSALGIVRGECEGTPSTISIQTNLAETTNDQYIGRVIIFITGNAAGEATDITDYVGSTGTLTVTALVNAPAATDKFVIV